MTDIQPLKNFNAKEINTLLDKLKSSKSFKKSKINQALFHYLLMESLAGKMPKEFTIAVEVFGKEQAEDTNVRAYIHNLRKKLVAYYKSEGKDDQIQFVIPKGGYLVQACRKTPMPSNTLLSSIHDNKSKSLYFILGLGIASLVYFALSIIKPNQPKPSQNDKKNWLWKEFDNDKETLLLIGDHFFFTDLSVPGYKFYSHSLHINSEEELNNFLIQHPEMVDKVERKRVSFMDRQSIYGLANIYPVLSQYVPNFQISLISEINWSKFSDKNIIFIGPYRSSQFLRPLFKKAGIGYNPKEEKVHFQMGESDKSFSIVTQPTRIDYPSMLFFKTRKNTAVLAFLSKFDIGNISLTNYFSHPDSLETFKGKLQEKNQKNFKALFKVSGVGSSEFNTTYLHLDSLNNLESILEIWP